MPNANPSPFTRLASATVSGLVSTAAQTFAGVKTFASTLIASAGIQVASLFNTNGTGSTDVCVKVGTTATPNAGAKLLSVRSLIGGSDVESLAVLKDGKLVGGAATLQLTDSSAIMLHGASFAACGNNGFTAGGSTPATLYSTSVGAGDVCVKVGTVAADASVNAAARLLSVKTGIGTGAEIEKLYVDKNGDVWTGGGVAGYGIFRGAGNGNQYLQVDATNGVKAYLSGYTLALDSSGAFNVAAASSRIAAANGASASDIAVKVGFSTADASVNASAKLFSVKTGIGSGSEVESISVLKGGVIQGGGALRLGSSQTVLDYGGYGALTINPTQMIGTNNGSYGWSFSNLGVFAIGATINLLAASGRFDQAGTDSSGTPGAATINKPTGKSAIASGATSVTITNSLVAAGDQVHITWHGDHGQTRDWVTTAAGSFTVNLNAAASANTAFCWTVAKRL